MTRISGGELRRMIAINIYCLIEFTIISIGPFCADRLILMLLRRHGEQCECTGLLPWKTYIQPATPCFSLSSLRIIKESARKISKSGSRFEVIKSQKKFFQPKISFKNLYIIELKHWNINVLLVSLFNTSI